MGGRGSFEVGEEVAELGSAGVNGGHELGEDGHAEEVFVDGFAHEAAWRAEVEELVQLDVFGEGELDAVAAAGTGAA